MSMSDLLDWPERILTFADPMWLVYFALGLLLVFFVARRQFNEPHWLVDDGNKIRGLPPEDIVERQRFRRARRLYLSIVVGAFLLLCTVPQALVVLLDLIDLATAFDLNAPSAEAGGLLPLLIEFQSLQAAGGQADQVGSSRQAQTVVQMQSNVSYPFVVAVSMIAAVRMPYVQMVEMEVRRFAQEWYGIPSIPEMLFHRLKSHDFPAEALDNALKDDPEVAPVMPRVQALSDAAFEVLGNAMNRRQFFEGLVKIFAYRLWVDDFKVWPSPDVLPGAPLLRKWNERVLDDIAAMEFEIEVMTAEESIWSEIERDPQKLETTRRVRNDRWKRINEEVKRLTDEVCSLLVLLDQRSKPPKVSKPVGVVLRDTLKELHERDTDIGSVFGRLVFLVAMVPLVWLGLSVFTVHGWRTIAMQEASDRITLDDPSFTWRSLGSNYDFLETGATFALSGIAVYGIAILVGGLWIGRKLASDARSSGLRTTLLIRVMGVSMACFFAVGLAVSLQLVLLLAARVDWNSAELWAWLRVANTLGGLVVAVLAQAALGAAFGGIVAFLIAPENRAKKLHLRMFWGLLLVLVMAGGGYLYGRYGVPFDLEATRELHTHVYMAGAAIMAIMAVALLGARDPFAFSQSSATRPPGREPAAVPLKTA